MASGSRKAVERQEKRGHHMDKGIALQALGQVEAGEVGKIFRVPRCYEWVTQEKG